MSNRILFAAARGARIQTEEYDFHPVTRAYQHTGKWLDIDQFSLKGYYRVNPEDEHLQYGPISTSLRELVRDQGAWDSEYLVPDTMRYSIDYVDFLCLEHRAGVTLADGTTMCDRETHRALFLLFLAELLADEGL